MSDKFYVGLDITGFEDNGKLRPISRVTLLVDDDNAYTAGDDTGATLEASCPHATQAMVDSILAQVKGYQYQAYSADDANIDPSAELGDGVTVGGVYSVLSRLDDDGSGYPSINAPGEAELEDEYPAAGPMTQEFNRKIAETNSTITKTSEEIRLEVKNELDGLSASFDVKLNSITSQVTGLNGQVSSLQQTASSLEARVSNTETGLSQTVRIAADGITITNAKGSALVIDGGQLKANSVTADEIDATNLKVSSANITGSLTIGQLPSSVATKSEIPTDVSDLNNDAGYQTRKGVVSIIDGTVTADYVEALEISAASLTSDEIYIYGSRGRAAGSITTTEAASYSGRKLVIDSGALELSAGYGSLYLVGGSGAYMDIDDIISCGGDVVPSGGLRYALGSNAYKWTDLYCANGEIITSDRTAKKEINYELDMYSDLFDQLSPCSYQLIGGESGRTHLGMISQEIETAMEVCGISDMDFAAFIKSPKRDENGAIIEGEYDYALRYTEFIPLLIWQVQKLKARVSELEGNHG